jgi:hypothetical protein
MMDVSHKLLASVSYMLFLSILASQFFHGFSGFSVLGFYPKQGLYISQGATSQPFQLSFCTVPFDSPFLSFSIYFSFSVSFL